MSFYVKTQAELDAIPLDTKDLIYINFGTMEKPAIVRRCYCYSVRVMNNNVVVTYSNSKVFAYNNSKVYAYDNSEVWARDNSKVYAYNNSNIYAHDNSDIYAYDNSKAIGLGNSNIYAYDNSKVRAHKDKNIASINDNAIVTNPSILCSGAELLNQCNGNIGNIKFAVSNVPDEKKDSVFQEFYKTNGRVFILTIRGIPYYCVYDFDTISVKFYTTDLQWAFEDVNKNKIFSYYLDNVLMPALVNAKFDKSTKSNII